MDTDDRKLFLDVELVSAGIVVGSSGGVGNKRDWLSEIGLQELRLRHVLGDLPEYIVIVPGIDEADLLSLLPEGLHNQVYRDDFPEVSDVDCAGRSDSGCTRVEVLLTFLPDDFIGVDVRPMY